MATFERDKGGMVEATLVQLWTLDHSIATTTEANLRGQLLTPVELHELYETSLKAGTPPCAPVIQTIERHRDRLVDCVRPSTRCGTASRPTRSRRSGSGSRR